MVTNKHIDLRKIWKLYGKVVSVEEYYHPVRKWTSILDDGSDVKSNDDMKYHRLGLEGIVAQCINSGAEIIQFKCRDIHNPRREYCFPDYRISELVANPLLLKAIEKLDKLKAWWANAFMDDDVNDANEIKHNVSLLMKEYPDLDTPDNRSYFEPQD